MCIFCQIVKGAIPAHRIFEDKTYLAFLSIFPNTEGVTVVIPKEHLESNFARCPSKIFTGLTSLCQRLATQICRAYPQADRCALVFEGYGVDHLHAKLFPLHGTAGDWQPREKPKEQYFETYPGYLSTAEPSRPAETDKLAQVAQKIRQVA